MRIFFITNQTTKDIFQEEFIHRKKNSFENVTKDSALIHNLIYRYMKTFED